MNKKDPKKYLRPLTKEQLKNIKYIISEYSSKQLAWLSGYFFGIVHYKKGSENTSPPRPSEGNSVTIISASQTGNARRIAEQLRDDLYYAKISVQLINASDYQCKKISRERLLVIIASTQGEGEPAEEAFALYKFLYSKNAPNLKNTAFAVFGLGDTSYEKFCKSGKDFDEKIAELGAERIMERIDADVEYENMALTWRKNITKVLKERVYAEKNINAPVKIPARLESTSYTKEHPLTAQLVVNKKITGSTSVKDVRHMEIYFGKSRMIYQPGDALGVWFDNDPALVEELVQLLWLKGDEQVEILGKIRPLSVALRSHCELTKNTKMVVHHYAVVSQNHILLSILEDKQKLNFYANNMPIVDMVRTAPINISADQLIAILKPLKPRLYSISSSLNETNEVHITVCVVRYNIDGHIRSGGASSFLADRLEENGNVRIFLQKNDHFRLPKSADTPIIMIGSGTGIAPFRAFMQQRDADSDPGNNFLLFGNTHFTEDFLYQVEWQRYMKDGFLTRIELSWSRDQKNKIYVQEKLRKNGKKIWSLLQKGAYIYICGDANSMAKNVENTLLEVLAEYGGLDIPLAKQFLIELRIQHRYQLDVY